jgi:hypothetical protein
LSGRLIPVATFGTRLEAETAQGLLASVGIDASLSADDAGGSYPPFLLSGGAQLLVDEDDAEAAADVLATSSDESQPGS